MDAEIEVEEVRLSLVPAANEAARGGKAPAGDKAELAVFGERDGWKLGASALSFFPLEDGID